MATAQHVYCAKFLKCPFSYSRIPIGETSWKFSGLNLQTSLSNLLTYSYMLVCYWVTVTLFSLLECGYAAIIFNCSTVQCFFSRHRRYSNLRITSYADRTGSILILNSSERVKSHEINNYNDTKPKCHLYWCLIEFKTGDTVSHLSISTGFVNYCPYNLLSGQLSPLPCLNKYIQCIHLYSVYTYKGGRGVWGYRRGGEPRTDKTPAAKSLYRWFFVDNDIWHCILSVLIFLRKKLNNNSLLRNNIRKSKFSNCLPQKIARVK